MNPGTHASRRRTCALLRRLIAIACALELAGPACAWAVTPDGEWGQIAPQGSSPGARTEQAAVFDPLRHRMVIIGALPAGNRFADTWALALDGTPTWTPLAPYDTLVRERRDHTAIYDPVRDRIIVFGGAVGGYPENDVWALTLAGTPHWTEVSPTGTPPPARYSHSAIYDPLRNRMIVYGGINQLSCLSSAVPFGDVWALSLAGTPAWSKLTPSGTPPPARLDHSAIYDPIRDRMVIFGGLTGGFCWCDCGTIYSDTWALSLSGTPAWSRIPHSVTDYGPWAYAPSAAYDALRDRMLIFGGTWLNYAFETSNDTWALPLDGSGPWRRLAPYGNPPAPRVNHSAIYYPQGDRMIIFGGQTPAFSNDVWSLYMNAASVSVEPQGAGVLFIEGVAPNPSPSQLTVTFTLPSAHPALLELMDVAGRRVAAREVGSLGPGRHEVRLGEPSRVPAGVYLVSLTQDGRRVVARAAIVH